MKSISSLAAILLFLVMATASFDSILEESNNTSVKISDCEEKPAVTDDFRFRIKYVDAEGKPIDLAEGKLFLVHQKVNPDTTCTFQVIHDLIIDFQLDKQGEFLYEGPAYMHDNSEDLWRIEVNINGTAFDDFEGVRQTFVYKYAQNNFVILLKDPYKL